MDELTAWRIVKDLADAYHAAADNSDTVAGFNRNHRNAEALDHIRELHDTTDHALVPHDGGAE
jgi:hypothetical protein